MPTYEEEYRRSKKMYPSLFPEGDEWTFLHHIFFVNGNGCEWIGGEVVDILDDYTDEYADRTIADREARFEKMWQKEQEFAAKMSRLGRVYHIEQTREEFSALINAPDKTPIEKHSIYPLCRFALCMHLPDNIQPDWLDAAERAYDAALKMKRTTSDNEYLARFKARLDELKGDRQ